MRFKLRCFHCKATCWARGREDSETNATEIDDSQELDWEWVYSKDNLNINCQHDEYEIVDSEYDEC